ncbi:MAG: transporter, CydDC cysteine exporter (CydDC-E) family, permease/ATP-binding protein CydC [Actinomycetia bacterium]|nr:transporter, CydDC cysteine exporter (CydDC-E) family, permease/ATP-binding protein CydC [Actinomycetes bacterium]
MPARLRHGAKITGGWRRLTGTRFGLAILAGAGALACSIGLMATSAWLISRAAQHPPVLYLMVAIVSVRAFGLGRGVLRYAERLISHDAALRLLAPVRVRVYERLAVLAPAGLHNARPVGAHVDAGGGAPRSRAFAVPTSTRPAVGGRAGVVTANTAEQTTRGWRNGQLLELVVRSVDGVMDRWLRAIVPMVSAAMAAGAAVALEWWLLPSAGAIMLAALLAGGIAAPWVAQRAAAAAERRAAGARAEMSALTVETLRGLPELVAYDAMPGRLATLRGLDQTLSRAAGVSAWTAGLGSALSSLACGVSVLGALGTGVPAVREGRLDGLLLAVIVLLPLAAFEPISTLSAAAQQLLRSRENVARLQAVLDVSDPVIEPPEPRPLPPSVITQASRQRSRDHVVSLRGVSTRWPGGEPITLPDLDLFPGRRLAILGRSGAGKSTLAAVLSRFLEYEGSVTLGGVELREMAGDDVRKVIGLCAQDPYLFDTTVAENVRLARPGSTDGEVAAVLCRAGLGGWLTALPDGLNTRVGEHGAAVSGGERQRIALARALLADFPILILDEPDAHLDAATADEVLAGLLDAAGDRTVLLITHRAAFPGAHPILRHVDEVLTLA